MLPEQAVHSSAAPSASRTSCIREFYTSAQKSADDATRPAQHSVHAVQGNASGPKSMFV